MGLDYDPPVRREGGAKILVSVECGMAQSMEYMVPQLSLSRDFCKSVILQGGAATYI